MNKELEMLLDFNQCLLADGFNEAIVGISQCNTVKAIYSSKKCIQILMERDKMTEEDAVEFFQHNVVGSYMGEKTPIFMIADEDTSKSELEFEWNGESEDIQEYLWTDIKVKEFCKIYTMGSYGDEYKGCKTMNQKIARYKELNK